ncbi:hypothetical protein PFISCL1PPCAC_16641, partial [Pristionchus fissidentatus]
FLTFIFLQLSTCQMARYGGYGLKDFTVSSLIAQTPLLVEDKTLFCSKELLSDLSPVFAALFYGDFSERRNGIFELGDVDYEEFVTLLRALHRPQDDIRDEYLEALLILSDRFHIPFLVDRVEEKLIETEYFNREEKGLLAYRYSLIRLEAHLCPPSHLVPSRTLEEVPELASIDGDYLARGSFPTIFCEGRLHRGDQTYIIGGIQWSLDEMEERASMPRDEMEMKLILRANEGRLTTIEWSIEGTVTIEMRDKWNNDLLEEKKYSLLLSNKSPSALLPPFFRKARSQYDILDPAFITTIRIEKVTGMRLPTKFDFSTPAEWRDIEFLLKDGKRLFACRKTLDILLYEFCPRNVRDGKVEIENVESEDMAAVLEFVYNKPAYTADFFDRLVRMKKRFGFRTLYEHVAKAISSTPVEYAMTSKIYWSIHGRHLQQVFPDGIDDGLWHGLWLTISCRLCMQRWTKMRKFVF